MNKAELIEALAARTEITKVSAGKILEALTDIISDELVKGNEVTIPNFVSFGVTHRAARSGRNPQTGQTIQIPATRIVKIKVGKKLKDQVSTK